jgi:hypothetical protein
VPMLKTSEAVSRPVRATLPAPQVGEEREGRVWDGEKWVSKGEWEKLSSPK